MSKHHGSCHCGKVDFDVDADIAKAMACNCSICSKRGHLLTFVPADKVTLNTPDGALTTYTFNKHKIRHQFCPTCGIAAFARGEDPSGNAVFAINVRCLDAIDIDKLEISKVDGRSF